MRLLLEISPERELEYTHEYKYKFQGYIWNCIGENSKFHDSNNSYFSFSNIFPFKEVLDPSESYHLIFSSMFPDIFENVKLALENTEELEIGELVFSVENVQEVSPEVGSVGTEGVLTAETGIYCEVSNENIEEYDVEVPDYTDDSVSWTPDMDTNLFLDIIRSNAIHKDSLVNGRFIEQLSDGVPLFRKFKITDTYGVQIPVADNYEKTFIISKANFDYTVQTPTHRRVLNTLVGTGLGHRNALGFGFVNITEKDGERL